MNETESHPDCDHDWQIVNHDESREIYKCTRCGDLRRV